MYSAILSIWWWESFSFLASCFLLIAEDNLKDATLAAIQVKMKFMVWKVLLALMYGGESVLITVPKCIRRHFYTLIILMLTRHFSHMVAYRHLALSTHSYFKSISTCIFSFLEYIFDTVHLHCLRIFSFQNPQSITILWYDNEGLDIHI